MNDCLPALVLLAGGKGSRMDGIDKSALLMGNRTFAEHAADEFSMFQERIFMGGVRAVAPRGFLALPDVREGIGPIGALCSALRAMHSSAAFVLACDMPFAVLDTALLLLNEYRLGNADVVYASSQRGIEPLCAIYSRSCAEPLEEMMCSGEYALRHLRARVRSSCVSISDSRQLYNVNTWDDYHRIALLCSDDDLSRCNGAS